MKFLHCMRKVEYLLGGLSDGLMLTNHKIEYSPTQDSQELRTLVQPLLPLIHLQLNKIGTSLDALSEQRKWVLFSGIGRILLGEMPMLCFTEVPQGRVLDTHRSSYGDYGLVVSRGWLERNGADRVVYVGQNSTVSQNLFKCLALLKIQSLFVDPKGGLVVFNSEIDPFLLDLLAHVEVRENLLDAEWRIAGKHGYLDGQKDTCKRLALPLADIEFVLVPNEADQRLVAEEIARLAGMQGAAHIPPVLTFPKSLPV